MGKNCKEYQKLNLSEINITGKEYSTPQKKMYWKMFETNNPTIALNAHVIR